MHAALPGGDSAVPVLPATVMPGIRAGVPVPFGAATTDRMNWLRIAVVAGVIARCHNFGA